MHNNKGEELTELEAKAYLEAAYPELKGAIEIKDKPDLRIKTLSGEIGIEVVVSYPEQMLRNMKKYGIINTFESSYENIICRFCKKQQKVKKYDNVSEMRLFIISNCSAFFENSNNLTSLLQRFLNESDNSFSIVYVMALTTLYEYNLTNRAYSVIKEFEGEQAQIARNVRKQFIENNKGNKSMNEIKSFRGEYEFLSNFYNAPVTYNGLTYQNSEAAFQAQKCTSEEEKKQFTAMNPSEAKRAGRRVKLRPDWEDVKIGEMRNIVQAKFSQNPELAEKLIQTGDAYLEEGNTWGDRTWGTVNGSGQNLLGKILMETREALKK